MAATPMRTEYALATLIEERADPDPIGQFRTWFEEAMAAGVPEPHAMTLATATPDGRPSARIVLLRSFDERGFAFFTNYESRKGRELAANPMAALVFFWAGLERQVRIEGRVGTVDQTESDAYFRDRPRGSRLGAWASPQSEVIPDRGAIERRMAEFEAGFSDGEVPRPPHWGGFRLVPDVVEFWQGRPSRLHDRLRYRRREGGSWLVERLAP